MRDPIRFFVAGNPKGQPRPRATRRGNHAGVYDPGTADDWKSVVRADWKAIGEEKFTTPLDVRLIFHFQRPKSHFKSSNIALRSSAPKHHTSKPDIDNCAKAVLDALTNAGAWVDDSLVTSITIDKYWTHDTPGCIIQIFEKK